MLAVEHALGRVRSAGTRLGPRTIDLDLLWIEGEAIEEDALVVPHPRLPERPFALRPLIDLVPDASDFRNAATTAPSPPSPPPPRRALTKVAEGRAVGPHLPSPRKFVGGSRRTRTAPGASRR